MRIFALICGVVAAGLWLGVGLYASDLLTPFLALWNADATEQMVARIIWFGVPGLAALGGLLVLANVFVGAGLLVLAAGGWFAIGSLSPSGPDLATLVPMGLALFAAILAVLGRRGSGEETPVAAAEPSAPRGFSGDHAERRGRGLAVLVGLNSLVTLVLVGMLGFIVYRDYVVDGRALPWETTRVASAAAPAATPARPSGSGAASAGPGMVVGIPSTQRNLPGLPGATPTPAAAASAGGATADIFSYCRQVDTIDYPDHRYTGPSVPPAVIAALGAPPSASADRVRWRCLDGAVLACATYDRPVCAMTPSVGEMMELCARRPNAANLLAPAGLWRCEGTRPVIASGENWPVDARGFLPGAWRPITAPAGSGAS